MLSGTAGGYFLRANIWPGEQDHAFRASGGGSFVYGTPHDHNFDFLTLGYFGPGYVSDYYEYDYEEVSGWSGEHAGLRFIERSTLSPGKLMFYRAHLDVHSQLPPKSMSVSLNVMGIDAAQGWHDQYRFDPASDTISAVLNPTSTETFLRLAVGLGGDEALDLAERFGGSHPSDRMRWASFEARALLLDREGRDALWRTAELSGNRLVAEEAKRRRRENP
ncbi:helix-turn-helix transcriptional regulator [Allopontixanthobacter sediminis]|uniref:helix-turn-helix transcriptional regulator n=1 Tax=Allopontixanthobacter sediminis TaxID=1689985 RepID=UPI001E5D3591|nr:helix-turn-helix transcriptional regulator [Allopontixanthobacter sediminis]